MGGRKVLSWELQWEDHRYSPTVLKKLAARLLFPLTALNGDKTHLVFKRKAKEDFHLVDFLLKHVLCEVGYINKVI
jgi:hypothetical protein